MESVTVSHVGNITIAELASAFFEEALRAFGDEKLAHRLSIEMVRDYLARQR